MNARCTTSAVGSSGDRLVRRGRGFTLIELMVVIAIIGVLAALLFPVFRNALARSRQAACKSNLHQFGLAIIRYRHDHNEAMPPWLSSLYPDYLMGKSTYTCHSDGSVGRHGSKPGIATAPEHPAYGKQFAETDDIAANSDTNRKDEVEFCSYMYEFSNAECGWAGVRDPDTDGNGTKTWCEVLSAKRTILSSTDGQ